MSGFFIGYRARLAHAPDHEPNQPATTDWLDHVGFKEVEPHGVQTSSHVTGVFSSRSTRSRSHSSIVFQLALTGCSGTLSRCGSRWKPGSEVGSLMSLPKWSSTKHSSKVSSKLPRISLAACMTS